MSRLSPERHAASWAGTWVAVWTAAALLAACMAPAPSVPVPRAAEAPAPTAAASLMADVRALADDSLRGRAAGTADAARAAAYVAHRFGEAGLAPGEDGSYRQPFPLATGGEGVNLVGSIQGTVHPQHALVVTAHYDHVGVRAGQVYNGADDNASGVAALFALAEHFRQRPPQHTIIFAALDGEEVGLLGAEALVERPPVPLGAVLVNVNLDMVSRGDGRALWVAGLTHYPHLREILEPALASAPAEVQFGHDTGAGSDNWTGASDHAAFHRQGVPFVYFGVEDHPDYHKPTDDAERIDPVWFAASVETIRRAVEALDAGHAVLVAGR